MENKEKSPEFSFGKLLKELRAESGLSQSELVREAFTSQDTVSQECGKSFPDFWSIRKLTETLDVSADYPLGVEN